MGDGSSLRGQPLLPGTIINLSFEEGTFSGSAGCNRYGGEYGATDDGSLGHPMFEVTVILCTESEGVMEQEQAYVDALASAVAYRLSEDRLELQDATGKTILVYARQPEYTMEPTDQQPSNLRDTTSTTSTLGVLTIGAYIDVLVYEGKEKLVLYNYASAIPWGDLVFDPVLEDMRGDYETVELPEDVQRQIDQVVTSFALEN